MIDPSRIPRSSIVGKALRATLRLIPREAEVRILQGHVRGMRWVVGASNHGCWLGTYEAHMQRAMDSALRPGDTVFDLGANAGFYTLLAARKVGAAGRVVAFEPLPRNLAYLRRHVAINRLGNVDVRGEAVSDRAGSARFRESAHATMGHLDEEGGILVRTVAIDELVRDKTVPPPSFLKIDVEGAEGAVLAGASETLRTHKPRMIVAIHGERARRACQETFREVGYESAPLDGHPPESTNEVLAFARES